MTSNLTTRRANTTPQDPLRILVIAPTPYFSDRGCHVRIWGEVSALQRSGHRPRLCTYHLGRDAGDLPIARTRDLPWYRKTEAGPSLHKLYIDVLLLLRVLREARREQVDVIHAHLHEGGWIGFWAGLMLRRPLVIDLQGSLLGEMVEYGLPRVPGLRGFLRRLESWIVHRADHVLASSPALFEFVARECPRVRERLTLVEDAVTPSDLVPASAREIGARADELGVAPGQPVVIYTGTLAPWKGVDDLFDAMPKVLKARPDTTFLLVGQGDVERYRKRSRALGVEAQVRFTGRVNYFALQAYLGLGAVAVDPKQDAAHESSGKLVRYLAAGLPVVAACSSNARQMLGDAGRVASEHSASSMADEIIALLEAPEQRAKLAAAGRALVEERFLWSRRIEDVISAYRGLLAR